MARNTRPNTARAKTNAVTARRQKPGEKETKKARTTTKRPVDQTSRPSEETAQQNKSEVSARVDQAVQAFEGAVDSLQSRLEQLREMLPDLVAIEVRRDRLRLVRTLADDGILDSLQRLATALENLDPGLPESLVPLRCSARMTLDRICRTFDVQAVFQPGESLEVTREQVKDFDWSGDHSGEFDFPVQVEILRSGWRGAEAVLVLPKARRGHRQHANG